MRPLRVHGEIDAPARNMLIVCGLCLYDYFADGKYLPTPSRSHPLPSISILTHAVQVFDNGDPY